MWWALDLIEIGVGLREITALWRHISIVEAVVLVLKAESVNVFVFSEEESASLGVGGPYPKLFEELKGHIDTTLGVLHAVGVQSMGIGLVESIKRLHTNCVTCQCHPPRVERWCQCQMDPTPHLETYANSCVHTHTVIGDECMCCHGMCVCVLVTRQRSEDVPS